MSKTSIPQMTAGDWMASYGGTYFKASMRDEGMKVVSLREAHNLSDDPHEVLLVVRTLDGEGHHLKTYEDIALDLEFPDLGFVNCKRIAMYNSRIAARQWKRGLRANQVDSIKFGLEMSIAVNGTCERDEVSFGHSDFLVQVFNPEFPNYSDALKGVVGGERYATAFSKKFALVAEPNYEHVILQYKAHKVGYINQDGEAILHERAQHLQPELNKAMGV